MGFVSFDYYSIVRAELSLGNFTVTRGNECLFSAAVTAALTLSELVSNDPHHERGWEQGSIAR